MKAYKGSRGIVPLILNLGTGWREWSTSHPGHYTPRKEPQHTLWIEGSVDNGDVLEKTKKLLSLLTFEPLRSSSPQPSQNASFPVPSPFFEYISSLIVPTGKNLQAPHMEITVATQRDPSKHATSKSPIKKWEQKSKACRYPSYKKCKSLTAITLPLQAKYYILLQYLWL